MSMTLKCIFLSIGWAVATGILTFMSVIGVSLSTLLYSGLSSTLVLISAYLLVAVIYSCITKCKGAQKGKLTPRTTLCFSATLVILKP